jgi:hypothetical protein
MKTERQIRARDALAFAEEDEDGWHVFLRKIEVGVIASRTAAVLLLERVEKFGDRKYAGR